MPSTLLHALLPGACAAQSRAAFGISERKKLARIFFACAFLGNMPDLDLVPGVLLPDSFDHIHRYWGHNVFALVAWFILGTWILRRWGAPEWPRAKAALIAVMAVSSHIALDAMSTWGPATSRRAGVPLLWPFSDWQFNLPLVLFTGVPPQHRYRNPVIDRLLNGDWWHSSLFYECAFGMLIFALWTAATIGIRKWRGEKTVPDHAIRLS